MKMLDTLSNKLADRLKDLRVANGLSLDQLAQESGVSRASLSRLEKAEVSPTADVLGRLCAVYAMPMSRLLMMVEDDFTAHIGFADQQEWTDPNTGFTRRIVSPQSAPLRAEVLECHLPRYTRIDYDRPPSPGLEHHLVLLDGALTLTVADTSHDLSAGDCLRYQLFGATRFETGPDRGARYMLFLT